MKKIAAVFSLAVLLAVPVLAGGGKGDAPLPRLLSPGDVAVLNAEGKLEFRWGTEGGAFDHYDFAIYKGTQPYEPYMILAKEISIDQKSVLIDGKTFEPGQSYSWSLRYAGPRRGLKAYSIFKIKA